MLSNVNDPIKVVPRKHHSACILHASAIAQVYLHEKFDYMLKNSLLTSTAWNVYGNLQLI